jgi:hypothetical protein
VFLNTDFHKGAGGKADVEIAQGRAVIDAAKQARCPDAKQIQLSWRPAWCTQALLYVMARGPLDSGRCSLSCLDTCFQRLCCLIWFC